MRLAIPVLLTAVALAAATGAAAAAPGKCALARIAEWPVRPGTGHPIVDGAINGQKIGILLDTGASRSLVVRPAAVRLGLVRQGARRSRMVGIGGETSVETVLIDQFAIGTDVRRNWRLLVAGEHDLGSDVAVILGEDFFRQADIEFDLAHDAVRLFEASDCGNESLAYWAAHGSGSVALERIDGAQPAIELTVELNGRPVAAQLDSGAFGSILDSRRAAELGVTAETAGVVAAGCLMGAGAKGIDAWFGPFESFRIGEELIRDPKIRFADVWRYSTYTEIGSRIARAAVHPDMLLGADFLRSHRVLVAHSQRRMYFTYVSGPVFRAVPHATCAEVRPAGEAKPAD